MKSNIVSLILGFIFFCKLESPCLAQQTSQLSEQAKQPYFVKADLRNCSQDSSSDEDGLNIAPVIAFGIGGLIIGSVVGSWIDPPPDGIEGEINIKISDGTIIGGLTGTAIGAYIGYRLAKKDEERQKRRNDGERKSK